MHTTTGSISATGADNALTADQNIDAGDSQAVVGVSGTFTSPTVVVEGRLAGGSIWYPVSMINRLTLARTSGSAPATTDETTSWFIDTRGFEEIRVYPSAGSDLAMLVEITMGTAEEFAAGMTQVLNAVAAATEFAAGISFTGATGTNSLSIPDNLANAFEILEAANSYLKIVTTNSGEKIQIGKLVELALAMAFTGATGVNTISIPDNLASALDITEAANSFLKFVTTNNAEAIEFGKPVRLQTPTTLAATGSAQGDAAAIVSQVTFVTAVDGATGVVLPAAAGGGVRVVYNTHATAGLNIYPASGDDINDGTGDAAIVIEGKSMAIFVALDATTWGAIFTADS